MTKQLLHLVFGGELTSLDKDEFKDLSKIHFVGLYPNYAKAKDAWKAAAQATVDNAHMRYYAVHLHRLLDPDESLHAAQRLDLAKKAGRGAKAKSTAARGKRAKSGNRR